jgi:hypothetical protein
MFLVDAAFELFSGVVLMFLHPLQHLTLDDADMIDSAPQQD